MLETLKTNLVLLGLVNPKAIKGLKNLPRFFGEKHKFRRLGGRVDALRFYLTDYSDSSGVSSGHYFHQDLIVAKYIYQNNPKRHIDVGSRLDGFVAHVASYRNIEFLDIRPNQVKSHENIICVLGDVMNLDSSLQESTDSLSCLHVIEHFGLGRYGDEIDPSGYKTGFRNLIRMLRKGGTLYISFPVGGKNTVIFNSLRIFHPLDIFSWAEEISHLSLKRFDFVNDSGDLLLNYSVEEDFSKTKYGCGIYTFVKEH